MNQFTEQFSQILTIFNQFITQLSEKIELKAFLLFGSRARGDALPSSDYDIIIIGNFTEPYLKRSEWIVQLLPFGIAVDLFCYTPDEFDILFNSYKITAIDAIDEGIPLIGEEWFNKYQEKLNTLKKHGLHKKGQVLYPPTF